MVSKQTLWERLYMEVVIHLAFVLALVDGFKEAWVNSKEGY